ncbi:MAG: glutathione S-transferase family protein [Mesorhizobium sp.]|uniref:glutathione S-transferase family protein n=1 Tax=unclassified Mesorhizobium TaxID=325217 RepID=UPI000F751D71|nr:MULTISPECIES: glutathione S-transferase family protein [unclassified Mesorhizobium]AZO66830.1 glutathione S-transferase family protein [Mesorhizobium sp. M6A.T.Cr.TU.016.01.1.1]RUU44153.1 glutathione S-transferase family protein [Mesorhizobium sp. M6A.T.Ce.TU.002.03.1.1]RWP48952.1 MAG: glutathione S-transferase family protein [Mesorhizobium sp.]RWP55949.1 MAG: glutathione S-transferase family protein [Mesorhizobium sp.]RWQ34258.1 MAG: glutathione S-transferase family protein [Mesorhizobium 
MTILYGMIDSGNCYKPRLLMAKLGMAFTNVEVSSHTGDTRKPDYVAKNPNAMVPLLELDDGRRLAESNAILLYLAEDTRFLPADKYERALAYQWLFFEQYSHEPYIAVRKALLTFPERAKDATPERLAVTLERGNKALGVMNKHLAGSAFFAGDTLSVADIALYAYTHTAEMGGFQLDAYPAVAAWLKRVEADPGHVPMEWLP